MLRRWLKKEIEYVPVPSFGAYSDISVRDDYLKELSIIGTNRVWISEITETIRIIRDMADKATTPDELCAYSACLKEVKKLLVVQRIAERRIEEIRFKKEIEAQK